MQHMPSIGSRSPGRAWGRTSLVHDGLSADNYDFSNAFFIAHRFLYCLLIMNRE